MKNNRMIEQTSMNPQNLDEQQHLEVESVPPRRPLSKGTNIVKSAAISVLLAASITSTDAFSPSHNGNGYAHFQSRQTDGRSTIPIYSTIKEEKGTDALLHTSHSNTALWVRKERRRRESRLGVRRRVRSVLERAKSRTGIRNSSEYLNKEIQEDTNNGSSSFNLSDIEIEVSDLKTVTNVPANNDSNAKIESAPIASPSVTVRSEPISIDTASPINTIAEAASIGGIGTDPLNYTAPTSSEKKTEKKKKTKPASTYSEPIVKPTPTPGAEFMPSGSQDLSVVDALKGDVSAAFSMPPPPLPFSLPELSKEQRQMLRNGERIQYQSDMGLEGSGYVVLDVKAPAAVVWECLLDFYSYPQTIPTVRDVQMFTNTHLQQDLYSEKEIDREKYEDGTLATLKHGVPSVTRASFSLSKFRLKIAAIHKYRPHPMGDYMVFTLDPACTNMVLQNAKGVWYTESNPDGRGDDVTRVWLLCELSVSTLLPKWIVDYAAKRAMPRATTWIKPHVEAAAELWFKELKD